MLKCFHPYLGDSSHLPPGFCWHIAACIDTYKPVENVKLCIVSPASGASPRTCREPLIEKQLFSAARGKKKRHRSPLTAQMMQPPLRPVSNNNVIPPIPSFMKNLTCSSCGWSEVEMLAFD